jgi:hypothetical protein
MQTSDNLDYLVSQGFSATIIDRFWNKVHKTETCWLWTAAKLPKGYEYIGKGFPRFKMALAHRVSWMIHFGPIPDGLDVLHSCDCPPCIRPDHLWTGTHLDNMLDKVSKGRHAVPCKITDSQVLEILRTGRTVPTAELAKRHGVSTSLILMILARKRRVHVIAD